MVVALVNVTLVHSLIRSYPSGIHSSLESKEIEGTVTKEKVVDHLNDALSKHADIVFLVLTFTSAGISLNVYIIKS
jgi:hypothetical protein